MNYGEMLENLRERFGLTRIQMAKIINVSNSLYGRYEKEIQIIPIKHLNTLCNYFGVSIDYIFRLTDTINYSNSAYDIDKNKMITRLKGFRKENKLTQIKLAQILNIANGTIAEYERGTNIIATPFLYTICKNYNVSADYLLGKTIAPKYLN